MKAFSINILGLSTAPNHFEYEFGDGFFAGYDTGFDAGSKFTAKVILDKHETFIDAHFSILGQVTLVCDRSLEVFDEPVKIDKRIVFKYGEEEAELSDEIIVIKRDRATLDLGQYVYEFIVLSLPMKRLHPKYRDDEEEDDAEGQMVYSSAADDQQEAETVDPRWEQLKKLK